MSCDALANEINPYFDYILTIVKEAGTVISERINTRKTVTTKENDGDLVTETDKELESFFKCAIKRKFPDHYFIGEESSYQKKICIPDDPTWVVDPLDGTKNFVHTFPQCCISIALLINQEPVIGIVYNPVTNQMFTAKKNQGAFLNDSKISVSCTTKLEEALLMLEGGGRDNPEKLDAILENYRRLLPVVQCTRALGSAALNMAMVAMGSADAYFGYGIHIWDMAAGELLITEAGGVVLDPCGVPIDRFSRRMLCAGTCKLAKKLSKIIVQYFPTPTD